MNGFEPFLDQPALVGQEQALTVLRRARSQSFLVASPREGDPESASGLLARFWLGAAPGDEPPELASVSNPKMADVRQILRDAPVMPVARDRRAQVVFLGSRPSREVVNALLRLTEEPPSHLGVFVATTEPRLLPATLVSRLVPLRLHPLPDRTVAAWLERRGLPGEQAQALARSSGGWVPEALRLAESASENLVDSLQNLLGRTPFGFVLAGEGIGKDRKAWVGKLQGELQARLREGRDPATLHMVTAARRAERDLEANLNGALVIENLMLELERLGRS